MNRDWNKLIKEESGPVPKWADRLLLGAFAVAVFTLAIAVSFVYISHRVVDGLVESYTDATPATFARQAVSQEEIEYLEQRIELFTAVEDVYSIPEPLVLSDDDINLLIQDHYDREFRRTGEAPDQQYSVAFEDGRLRTRISLRLPVDFASGYFSKLNGRYVNGLATLRIRLVDGALDIHVDSFEVGGEALPEWIMRRLRRELDRIDFLEQPGVNDFLENVDSLEIVDGEVILRK